jgi:hypothetical protein
MKYHGEFITHIRICESAAELPITATESHIGDSTESHIGDSLIYMGDKSKEITAPKSAEPLAEEIKEDFSGKGKEEKARPELQLIAGGLTEESMNAKDYILKAQAKDRPVPKSSAEALREAWRAGVHQHHKTFVPALTGQQMGQLKHFENRTPPGRAVEILSWALEHWDRFRNLTEEEAGAFNTPTAPMLGFLLKHVQLAIKGEAEVSAPENEYKSKVKIGGPKPNMGLKSVANG